MLLGACQLSPSAPTAHTHIPHTPSKREVPGAHALALILSAELGEITESLKFHSFPMVIIISPPRNLTKQYTVGHYQTDRMEALSIVTVFEMEGFVVFMHL